MLSHSLPSSGLEHASFGVNIQGYTSNADFAILEPKLRSITTLQVDVDADELLRSVRDVPWDSEAPGLESVIRDLDLWLTVKEEHNGAEITLRFFDPCHGPVLELAKELRKIASEERGETARRFRNLADELEDDY
jgi:hypothetical protein